jgi:hypothetical protein
MALNSELQGLNERIYTKRLRGVNQRGALDVARAGVEHAQDIVFFQEVFGLPG